MGTAHSSTTLRRTLSRAIARLVARFRHECTTLTRGLSAEEGGYHWGGELRLWDNEILMGWYASNDGSIRSKGTMYFVVHPQGLNMSGRWVGLGYDDQIMTGFASMAHSREESEETMARLIHSGGVVARAAS